jgi:acyl-CoA reductase-like NAD-dependent aldehyde dehydrogenase
MQDVDRLVKAQEAFFLTGQTRALSFRRKQLRLLLQNVRKNEAAIVQALQADLGKPEFEAVTSELAVVYSELTAAIRNVKRWAKPRRKPTPALCWPSRSRLVPEPKGRALVIAPWNYPFQLSIGPAVSALAAGNCVIIKPSEYASATAKIMAEIIADTFPPHYCALVQGSVPEVTALLHHDWGQIFFTGSTQVGRIVMQAAALTLSPVTLELGGKNPVIVDDDIDVEATARRIVWGKFFNNGQTCIAPDYLLVADSVKDDLLKAMIQCIKEFYGLNPEKSPDYGRIVNERQFDRLLSMMDQSKVVYGGQSDRDARYVAPTLMDGVGMDHPVMATEIFGPILPVLSYKNLDEALAIVAQRSKPLSLYVFSRRQKFCQKVMASVQFGGGCINTTLLHFINHNLPFGGIGPSGMGNSHGKYGFDTFTHYKSLIIAPHSLDLPVKYPPYGALGRVLRYVARQMSRLAF